MRWTLRSRSRRAIAEILDGVPLKGVTLRIDNQTAKTDGTGRFLLGDISAGHHAMVIDGRTANNQKAVYGVYEVGVDVIAGRTTALDYTIWMTELDSAHAVCSDGLGPTLTDQQ
jgi:hypothetical protein